jgi:O-antigen/teichoic acid export membrane protein
MGTIRKQAIYSSIVIYLGFLIGFVNTWFFIRSGEHTFTPDQYGLTRLFFDVGQLMYSVASFGVAAVAYKFFPYYQDNLPKKQIDLYAWVLLIPAVGFLLVIAGGYLFEPLIVRKYSARSPLFVDYYNWIYFFGAGFLLFSVFEAISWTRKSTVFPNFLKESGLRLLSLLLILIFYFQLISFDGFIKLFSFQYLAIAFVLFVVLKWKMEIPFTLKQSRVTQKFKKKMFTLGSLVYGGTIIVMLSQVADSIIIASISEKGTHDTGVYNFSVYIANLVQVPQRSIMAIALPVLSQAWKDKNMNEIERVYKRTSINLLLLGLFILGGILLNIKYAYDVFGIQEAYKAGINIILVLGITRLIDAGTGVNGEIIGTSTQWRFEFFSRILLIVLFIPLNYILIKQYGLIGAAYGNLIAFTVYNTVRIIFLKVKFNLQPFTNKTLLSLIMAAVIYSVSHYLFSSMNGLSGIIARSSLFTVLFVAGVYFLKLTPDAQQLIDVVKKRLGMKALNP